MPNLNWYIAETTANREAIVAYALNCFGIECYLPIFLQSERAIIRKRQKEIACRASIPRLVFFRCARATVEDVLKIKDVLDVIREGMGDYAAISGREVALIQQHHASLMAEAVEAHASGKIIRNQKRKDRAVKMTKETLMEWLAKNMGMQASGLCMQG